MKQSISRLSLSDPLLKLCLLLKMTESKASAFAFFPDDAISFAMDQYATTKDTLKNKDPVGWCFDKARSYCKDQNKSLDWSLYKSVKDRYSKSHVAAGGWKIEEASNVASKEKRGYNPEEMLKQQHLLSWKRWKQKRIDDPSWAAKVDKELLDTGQSLERCQEILGAIDLQTLIVSDHLLEEERTVSSFFEDGQPVRPDYIAMYESLDSVDDSTMEETTVSIETSQNRSVASILKETGLF